MCDLRLIESTIKPKSIRLHENIHDILFSHKQDIFRMLCDIKGIHFLEHIAITIINPDNEIVIFSITPSVEYNIIVQNIWKYDYTFNPYKFNYGSIIWWEENLTARFGDDIVYLKKTKHNFTAGMNLYKKSENFAFIYSFATRVKMDNIRSYYENITDELYNLGDYSYKMIRSIYERYSGNHTPPHLDDSISKHAPYLKLIFNNEQSNKSIL